MQEVVTPYLTGIIRVYEQDHPERVHYCAKNVICNGVKSLFARMMKDVREPNYGVWGLAIGAGKPEWTIDNHDEAIATQTALFSQIMRKPCNVIRFVKPVGTIITEETVWEPVLTGTAEAVEYQTPFNATKDQIKVPIQEMGLIGGGQYSATPTDMYLAPFWDAATCLPTSVSLINYKTLAPLSLPEDITMVFSWVLVF